MPIPSSDDSRPDTVNNNHGSRRISREIANLQQEIRDDFDQKLKELSGLMVRFRSLLSNDAQIRTDLAGAANDATLDDISRKDLAPESKTDGITQIIDKEIGDALADIPILTDRINNADEADSETSQVSADGKGALKIVVNNDSKSTDTTPGCISSVSPSKQVSRFSTEPARFESGLYQLNSQLYRFKLELDQELEFREEPLHIHFQHQSELAMVLQQITEKMQQEKNTGR